MGFLNGFVCLHRPVHFLAHVFSFIICSDVHTLCLYLEKQLEFVHALVRLVYVDNQIKKELYLCRWVKL